MKYFVQYPGIFELFYLEKTYDLGHKKPTINLIYSFLDSLCEQDWNYCLDKKIFSESEIEIKKEALRNVTVGVLLFYLNRYNPPKYDEFIKLTERQINYVFK